VEAAHAFALAIVSGVPCSSDIHVPPVKW